MKNFIAGLALTLLACNCSAAISCSDVEYGTQSYQANLAKLAVEAKLPADYWNRRHEDLVRMICKQGGKGLQEEIAAGTAKKADVSRLIEALLSPKPHHYVVERAGQYGYELALSAEDIRSGITTKPLMMVTYKGQDSTGAYHVMWSDGQNQAEADCTAPCEFAHVLMLGPTVTPGEQTVRAAKGSMIWAIFQDAMAGQLK
jgi:hypothetical protein